MAVSLSVSPSPSSDDEDEDVVSSFYEIIETPRSQRSVNATVQVQFVLDEESEDEYEIIDFRVVPTTNQPNVRIFNEDEETIRIVGTYFDPFLDIFTYVEKGSSDKLEQPKVVVGIANLPEQKDFFNLNQDGQEKVTVFYLVTVEYKDVLTEELFIEQFELTHDILNEFEGLRLFVSQYYG
jgi:hypothetical protein